MTTEGPRSTPPGDAEAPRPADPRSSIPSVDRILLEPELEALFERFGRERVVVATREAVADVRARLAAGHDPTVSGGLSAGPGGGGPADASTYVEHVRARLAADDVPSLRSVINATGVVLHTNLGRAPLAAAAVEAMREAGAGYTNLEYDLALGRRGSRYAHCVALLTELTGAEGALVVNNAAGGLVLAMNTLARRSGVAVSRGELVEIGGGFRIPEVLERAGADLVEVGSTNRTRIGDYRRAFDGGTLGAVLKVHRSNFRITGFTEEASLAELAELTRAASLPLVYDLGSGLLADPERLGLPPEPRPADALREGADLVVFSGDKLLGGPQSGIVLGRAELVAALRSNPLCRALRVDKVTLAGLEATLRLYRRPDRALEEIPVLAMLAAPADALHERALRLAGLVREAGIGCAVEEARGAVGGGTYPGVEIPGWALAPDFSCSPDDAAARLRDGDPPVIGRVTEDHLLLDVRTVMPDEEGVLVRRVIEVQHRASRR